MKRYIVTCTKILNGVMFIDAENSEDAVKSAQEKLNENVDCIDWDFGEATADYAEEEPENNDGDGEEESRIDPNYEPKYKVGDHLVWHHYDNETKTVKDDIFQITAIKDGKYICSDGKEDTMDFLDYDKDFRLATDDEVRAYNKLPIPKYRVGDIVKSDISSPDKIVRINDETYFFESGEQSDITALDDDATFYLVQPNIVQPKYKVGECVGDFHYGYYEITEIKNGKYVFENGDEVAIDIFDDDENHHVETIHREDFKPFDKVIVRDDNRCVWVCAFYSHLDYSSKEKPYVTCGGEHWEQCLPFNDETEYFVGVIGDYHGKYQTW